MHYALAVALQHVGTGAGNQESNSFMFLRILITLTHFTYRRSRGCLGSPSGTYTMSVRHSSATNPGRQLLRHFTPIGSHALLSVAGTTPTKSAAAGPR